MTLPRPGLKGFERLAATVKPHPTRRQLLSDPDTRGLYLRVTPKGAKSWTVVARNPVGKQVWAVIGAYDEVALDEARRLARENVRRIKSGQTAPTKAPQTFKDVAELFVKRWVDKGGRTQNGVPLRSKPEIERQLKAYVYPRWQSEPFLSIRRGAVTELMDELVDNNGAVQADRVLATLAKLFNWYRQYDENYVSPIIPEMKRSGSPTARARTRILSDEELRLFWTAAEDSGAFGRFLQTCLLTGQRRGKVMTMRWEDLTDDGVWVIAVEPREKGNAGALKLPKLALEIVRTQAMVEDNPYVFSGRGSAHLEPGDKLKKDFDAKVAKANNGAAIPGWTIHDLRRTARSLLARAGVRPDIAERTLGHVIRGVEGTYDRHAYTAEKADALEKLAELVERIIDPPAENVVPLRGAAQ